MCLCSPWKTVGHEKSTFLRPECHFIQVFTLSFLPDNLSVFKCTSIFCHLSTRTILPNCSWFAHLWKCFRLIFGAGNISSKTAFTLCYDPWGLCSFKSIWCNNHFWASTLCKVLSYLNLNRQVEGGWRPSFYFATWTLEFFVSPHWWGLMACPCPCLLA